MFSCIQVFLPTNWRNTQSRAKPALLQQRSQPNFLANQTMSRALVRELSRSRRDRHAGIAGRADTRDARGLARQHYAPQNTILAISGRRSR